MFKQIKIWSVIALMLFACNVNEQEVTQLSVQDAEFVQLISDESTFMFSSVIGDLKSEFKMSSLDELTKFDSERFIEKSILRHSRSSELLSSSTEAIKQFFNQRSKMQSARAIESSYSEQEKEFLEKLKNAFLLMPDVTAFKDEMASINIRIAEDVKDENAKKRLLAISSSSEASAIYWAENQEEILIEMQSVVERLNGEELSGERAKSIALTYRFMGDPPDDQGKGGKGGKITCCFKGKFKWNWKHFGGYVIAGGARAAATTWIVNVVPGVGQAAYGASIIRGGVGGGAAYTGKQIWNWMWSKEEGANNNGDDKDQNR